MPANIAAVVFDFYGVIQTDQLLVWTERNFAHDAEAHARIKDITTRLDVAAINDDEYFAELAELVGRSVDAVKAEMKAETKINEPLLEVLKELSAKAIPTALLSNDGSSLRAYLHGEGLHDYFDYIFVSGEIGLIKPNPAIFKHVATDLGFAPTELMFFDDRQENVDGAKAAGWQAEVYVGVNQVRKTLADLL